MPLSAGTRLGPYEVMSSLGAGGMGEVYRVRDPRLGREVALKVLASPMAADPERLERFAREARAVASLNHPHIVTIHSTEEADGVRFLTMELVEGQGLDSVIGKGPLPLDQFFEVAIPLADAVRAAHEKNITHRDLKPANVMLDLDGRVKVLDFGLARFTSDQPGVAAETRLNLTGEGAAVGTPAYMSPEQIEGKTVDHRSDLFSLGVVLYEMLTGQRPFAGDSSAGVMSSILRDAARPIQQLRKDVPASVEDVITRSLEKQPGRRLQTARELRDALKAAQTPSRERAPAREDTAAWIAVLPFANMSSDPEQEYFSDGLTEEIINALAQIRGLKVIARTSAFAFKGQNLQIGSIAQRLGVSSVLEGSVRRSGNRIRVTAQLVTAADGCPLWSERYDRELADVFAVQDDIASAIVRELRGRLALDAVQAPAYRPAVPAYEAFLMARHHVWRHSAGSFTQGLASYQEAIALDPRYADPHVGVAETLHIRASFKGPEAQAAARGIRPALERALALDPAHPEANAWLGVLASTYEYDWKEAGARFRTVTAAEPVAPRVRHIAAYFHLRFIGQADRAVEAHHRALHEDPLNLIMRVGLATCLTSAGRHAEAAHEAHRLLELAPDFAAAYTLLALDVAREPLPVALAYAERLHAIAPYCAGGIGLCAGLLFRAGEEVRARALFHQIGSPDEYGNSVDHALYHLARGETDGAFDYLERLADERHPFLMMALVGGPYGEALRASARWPSLAQRLGLA